LDWKYDENLERELAGNQDWSDYVQKVRRFIEAMKIRHVVSPRASIYGAKLLANGISRETVEQTVLWKGLDDVSKNKVIQNLVPKEIEATRDGQFIPKVEVGDTVKKDDVIGVIEYRYRDNWGGGDKREDLKSQYNGDIIFISTTQTITVGDIVAKIESYDII
jgi:ribosomal protein L19